MLITLEPHAMVYFDQILHILYFTSLAGNLVMRVCQASFWPVMLNILNYTYILIKFCILVLIHFNIVCQRVTKVTSNDVTSSPA